MSSSPDARPLATFVQLPPRGLRVLVVEANDGARERTASRLERLGCTVVTARDRAHALCRAALQEIDVVLGGVALPEIGARCFDLPAHAGAPRLTTLAAVLAGAYSAAAALDEPAKTASRASA